MLKNTIHIGFTGNQHGMSEIQYNVFRGIIILLNSQYDIVFHHGVCIGSDEDAHNIVMDYTNAKIQLHPPIKTNKMFKVENNKRIKTKDPKEYLERNRDIVNASRFIFATPKTNKEKTRSGTWSTIRYNRKKNKHTYIILPKGLVVKDKKE